MSAANAVSSEPSPPEKPEAPAAEPSMEDILASIRRIIADDQSRGVASTPSSLRRTAALNVTPPTADQRVERPLLPLRPENAIADAGRDDAVAAPASLPPTSFAEEPLAAASPGLAVPRASSPVDLTHVPASMPQPAILTVPEPRDHIQALSAIAEAGVAAALRPANHGVLPDAIPEPDMDLTTAPLDEEPDVLPLNGYETGDPLLSDAVEASIESSFQQLATSVFMRNTGAVDAMIRDMLRPLLKTWLDDNLPTIVERLVRAEIERVARGDRH